MRIINANKEEREIIVKCVKKTGLTRYLKSVKIVSQKYINQNSERINGKKISAGNNVLGSFNVKYNKFDIPEYTILILSINNKEFTTRNRESNDEYSFERTLCHELGHLNTYIDTELRGWIKEILKDKRNINWAEEEFANVYSGMICLVDCNILSYQKELIFNEFVEYMVKCNKYKEE